MDTNHDLLTSIRVLEKQKAELEMAVKAAKDALETCRTLAERSNDSASYRAANCALAVLEIKSTMHAGINSAVRQAAHPKTVIAGTVGNDQVENTLQKAAAVAIQLSRPPRDLLGPATTEMKYRAALGERIAVAIVAINSPQYEEGRAAYYSGKKFDLNPYERGSDDSRTWHMGFEIERTIHMTN